MSHNPSGFTLIEVLVTIAIIGILVAATAPLVTGFNKPLQNATNQISGILKQARMRAIATTTAYRITPRSDNQGLIVEAATSRGCGSTTQLTQNAATADTTLNVATTRGFIIGDSILVGSDSTNNNIIGLDSATSRITIGAPLGTAQTTGSNIELVNNWRSGGLITGFSDEDLRLPQPQSSIFSRIQQSPEQQIRLTSSPSTWRLCFDSRGTANLINPSTGQPISNTNLVITLQRFNTNTSSNIGLISGVKVLPGGTITFAYGSGLTSSNFDSKAVPDTTAIAE